jgi:hypothetical protein
MIRKPFTGFLVAHRHSDQRLMKKGKELPSAIEARRAVFYSSLSVVFLTLMLFRL